MMASSSDEEFEVNDQNCQKVIDEFVTITNTNDALAQMFLQERKWNLKRALADYFDDQQDSQVAVKKVTVTEVTLDDSDEDESPSKKLKNESGSMTAKDDSVDVPKSLTTRKELIFITWNIDGISEENRQLRTKAVCQIIKAIQADVVFLQEIVPQTEAIIKEELADLYHLLNGRLWNGFEADYYTMTLVNKNTVHFHGSRIVNYKVSVMTRNMLVAKIERNGTVIHLINTHLESTKDFSSHRFQQIKEIRSFTKHELPPEEPIIIAGDLNLRDKELEDWGGIPPDWIDVWVATGSRPECKFTWDMLRNDNLKSFGKFKPRCRFDRVWVRDTKGRLLAHQFSLIGLERLKPHVCFPSDHWGILCVFDTLSVNIDGDCKK